MTAFLVGIVGLCIGFLVGRAYRTRQENQGEAAVRRLLSDRFPSSDYHLLNNVTLPDGDGTTQIDHVLVSRYGIFVLEVNGLYKAELIHRRAPWKTRESVELATLEWAAWFNNDRLLAPIGYIPPVEAEANYYRQLAHQATTTAA